MLFRLWLRRLHLPRLLPQRRHRCLRVRLLPLCLPSTPVNKNDPAKHPSKDKGVKKSWLKKINKQSWEVKPVRPLAPGRKAYTRGSERRLARRTRSTRGLREAVHEYEEGKLSPGTRKALNAMVAFWERRATTHRIPPWPLDVQRLRLLGSLLHAGGHRSSFFYAELWP